MSEAAPVPISQDPTPAGACVVAFARSKVEATAQEGEHLLAVAERAGIDIPALCRGGTCGTCKCRLISGRPKIDTLYALSQKQRMQGWLLTCSARATPGRIVLDA